MAQVIQDAQAETRAWVKNLVKGQTAGEVSHHWKGKSNDECGTYRSTDLWKKLCALSVGRKDTSHATAGDLQRTNASRKTDCS